jgi:hypothetical protein
LSISRWIVSAAGYAIAKWKATWANTNDDPIRRRESKMTSCFEFYRAENIGSSASLVFTVLPRFASRHSRGRRNVRMQRNRLLSRGDSRHE